MADIGPDIIMGSGQPEFPGEKSVTFQMVCECAALCMCHVSLEKIRSWINPQTARTELWSFSCNLIDQSDSLSVTPACAFQFPLNRIIPIAG